ncbi:hypothetical protein GDO81_016061 [Engystomops pustulosus]|uniref:Ribosomal protein S15 n=1 Tax=Engystomops pustulosus TaxID=76066 RepID=A0AAV7ATY8_ENGPU|nr:hypothetical protein GDO81_016061 [Engystomops pustulosus]
MSGIFRKYGFIDVKKRNAQIRELTTKLHSVEEINKSNHSSKGLEQIQTLRTQLQHYLLHSYNKQLRKTKATYYSQGNKAGKILANQMKQKHLKSSTIPLFYNPADYNKS